MRTERGLCWDGKTHMAWVYNDGGRAAAGFKGRTGDCVTRAIAIATGLPYLDVYASLNGLVAHHERARPGRKSSNARTGVRSTIFRRYLINLGWKWRPTMQIGSGTQVHLCEEELPMGRLIVQVSRHVTTVIDHELHDTYDCQRDTIVQDEHGERIVRRCVYGYFFK